MTGLLTVLVAIAAVQLLLMAGAVVVGLDYARRAMVIARALQTHAEVDSNETFPAIRDELADVVNALYPPTSEVR